MKYIYEDLITHTILEKYGVDISDNSLSAMLSIGKADLDTNVGSISVFGEKEQLDFEFTITEELKGLVTCTVEKY